MQRAHQTPGTHAGGPAAITAGVPLLGRWAEGEEVSWPPQRRLRLKVAWSGCPLCRPRKALQALIWCPLDRAPEVNVT